MSLLLQCYVKVENLQFSCKHSIGRASWKTVGSVILADLLQKAPKNLTLKQINGQEGEQGNWEQIRDWAHDVGSVQELVLGQSGKWEGFGTGF